MTIPMTIQEIGREVAWYLPKYASEPSADGFAHIGRKDGEVQFLITLQISKGAIVITGELPKDLQGRVFPSNRHISIKVGINKQPEMIAKEMQRRFLGEYEEAARLGAQQIINSSCDGFHETAEKLASLVGVKPSANGTFIGEWGESGEGIVEVRVNSKSSVDFLKLTGVPVEDAEVVLKTLKLLSNRREMKRRQKQKVAVD